MAEVVKFMNELFPAVNDIFGEELLKHGSISTNLPCDNLGFWLTQGVPIGIFILHLIMVILGERDIGRCFVTGNEKDLSDYQERYITEFCLDQAVHSDCFSSNDSLDGTTCQDFDCDSFHRHGVFKPLNRLSGIDTLFIYRYHIWFLFLFVIIRALPQLAWRLFCKAHIRKAVQEVATVAEFQHATCVIMTLNGEVQTLGELGLQSTTSTLASRERLSAWSDKMNEMVIEEVRKRAQGKWLFTLYVMRKSTEIVLDAAVITLLLIVFNQERRTAFDHLAFVCDLQMEPANALLCKAVKDQYIPCTVSFGVEFYLAIFVLGFVLCIDLLVQFIFVTWFTRLGHLFVRTVTCRRFLSGPIEFWDDAMTRDLELEQNEHWRRDEIYGSFVNTPNDLYLIGLMYRQSNVSHGHFLKMVAEKMVKDLHPDFGDMNSNQSAPTSPRGALSPQFQNLAGSSVDERSNALSPLRNDSVTDDLVSF